MLTLVVLGVALSCAQTGCPLDRPPDPPGDVNMGTYLLTALPALVDANGGAIRTCELEEVTFAPFTLDVVLTRNSESDEAFLTLAGRYTRTGTWDGQTLTTVESARRFFTACTECKTRLEERLTVALLSRSQAAAVGNTCPEAVLDGGLPSPDPDAGIELPGPRDLGFDAILACGALSAQVLVDEGPADGGPCPAACSSCAAEYRLVGERR